MLHLSSFPCALVMLEADKAASSCPLLLVYSSMHSACGAWSGEKAALGETWRDVCEHEVAMAMQVAIGIALVAWKKPEALRPSNITAAATAPGRAAVGWVQEALIPPGPALPEEDARSLVLQWQATKAQALGV